MNGDIEDRISGYFDESLSGEEMAELAGWIRADPANARRFARAAMLHDRLQSEMKVVGEPEKVIRIPTRWLAAAAAVVALLIGIFQFWPSAHSANGFVTIARVDGAALKVGARLGKGVVQTKAGVIRMLFDSGVEVTIEGPAAFEFENYDRMTLSEGLLTANVPPGAEGFRVDTPTAQITDLGTAFGVHLGEDGASHVSVFDGEVEVEELASGFTKRLVEGEEVVVTPERKVEIVNFDATPYEKVWPVSTGIESSTGSFELAPPWPRRLPLLASDDHAFVAPDGYRMELDDSLEVNISKAGSVTISDELSPSEIPAGTPLRSYILHYRPEKLAPRRFPKRLKGAITFDQPIAGLIVLREEFKASAGRFSKAKDRRDAPAP